MKRIAIALCMLSLFAACGGADSKKLGQDVCDCYKKANGMDAADPKRLDAQNECIKMQGENWNKVKDDQKKSDEYNKMIGDCSKEMIKQSMGQ
jgi:hypothetical protein